MILLMLVAESQEACTLSTLITANTTFSIELGRASVYPNDPTFIFGISGRDGDAMTNKFYMKAEGCERDPTCYQFIFENGTEIMSVGGQGCMSIHVGVGNGPQIDFGSTTVCQRAFTEVFKIRYCCKDGDCPSSGCGHCDYTEWIHMTMQCGVGQNTISKTGETIQQFAAIDTLTPGNTAFTFPTLSNSHDGCGYIESTLAVTGVDSALMGTIDTSSVPWKVSPITLNDYSYQFRLYIEDEQPSPDNEYHFPDDTNLYKLIVGCPESEKTGIDPNTPSNLTTSWPSLLTSESLYVDASPTSIYHFVHDGAQTTDYTCFIHNTISNIQYSSIVDGLGNALTSNIPTISQTTIASSNPCDMTDCGYLSLSSTNQEFYMLFTFDVQIVGQVDNSLSKATRTIGPIAINVTCWGHPQLSLSLPIIDFVDPSVPEIYLVQNINWNNTITFTGSSFAPDNCSQNVIYSLIDANNGQSFPSAALSSQCCSLVSGTTYSFSINVTNLSSYSIQVVAQTSPLDYITVQSAPFTVTVHQDSCEFDYFELNQTMPDYQETTFFNDYVIINNSAIILNIEYRKFELVQYEIPLTQRFTVSQSICQVVEYRIAEVKDGDKDNSTISQSQYADWIEITQYTGIFKVINFKAERNLYISIEVRNHINTAVFDFIQLNILPPEVVRFNMAPQFDWDPNPIYLLVNSNQSQQIIKSDINYTLPNVTEPNNDTFSVEIMSKLPQWITYSEEIRNFTIYQNKLSELEIGIFVVSIRLIDAFNAKNDYSFKIEILRDTDIQVEQNEQIQTTEVQVQNQSISAEIISIDQFGQLQIEFNTTMEIHEQYNQIQIDENSDNSSLNWLNSSLLSIYIDPSPSRSLIFDDVNRNEIQYPLEFNLTWYPISFKGSKLILQIIFQHAERISFGSERDNIVVQLVNGTTNSKFFHRQSRQWEILGEAWWKLTKDVKKQMPMNDGGKTKEFVGSQNSFKDLMMVFLVFSILIFLIAQSKKAMRAFFILIRTLQLIMHLPMFQIQFPSNFMTLIQILIPTLGFDVLETTLDWEDQKLIKFDFEGQEAFSQEKIDNQLIEIGYETPNSVILLNTLAIFLLFYVIKFSVLCFVTIYVKMTKGQHGGVELQKSLVKQLLFDELISLSLSAYIEFSISGILTYQFGNYKTSGEIISTGISFFSLFICLIFLPLSLFWILKQETCKLHETQVLQIWGQLYTDTRYYDVWSRSYYLIFILRRIIYILIAFFIKQPVILQIIYLLMTNKFTIIYQGKVRPAVSKFENWLELGNEWLVNVTTMTIILFTPWINEPTLEYYLGWSSISLTILTALVNICNVIYCALYQTKLIFLRYINKYKNYRFIRAQAQELARIQKEVKEKAIADEIERQRIIEEQRIIQQVAEQQKKEEERERRELAEKVEMTRQKVEKVTAKQRQRISQLYKEMMAHDFNDGKDDKNGRQREQAEEKRQQRFLKLISIQQENIQKKRIQVEEEMGVSISSCIPIKLKDQKINNDNKQFKNKVINKPKLSKRKRKKPHNLSICKDNSNKRNPNNSKWLNQSQLESISEHRESIEQDSS